MRTIRTIGPGGAVMAATSLAGTGQAGTPAARPRTRRRLASPWRGAVATVALAVVAAGVTACGGDTETNGLEKASPAEVGTRSVEALRDAGSVRVLGTVQDPSSDGTTTYDLVMAGSSARGTVTSGQIVAELVKVDDDTFTKGSREYYESIGEGDAAELLADQWVRLSTEAAAQYRFFSIEGFVQALGEYVAALDGEVTTEEVGGRRAVVAGSPGGTRLWAANTGEPVPLRMDMLDGEEGRMEFSDYDAAVSITAPTSSVDLSSLS
ncbi:hypothetical protein CC117_01260 [Parafrankia colletiae]|uniref:Lipoprotein n=1 Tax=Parafrankia colletiae TaxID=573497 RepID=A0A1S1RND7_9ACTN|nr:hypothetical protein [Parafrankia colletiae]MCK9899824.1 hypothetical protein [Frankia sp. Cpl3]OHV46304.1 hypothetical protein CC117_01260 [Parafrankia colletiae]